MPGFEQSHHSAGGPQSLHVQGCVELDLAGFRRRAARSPYTDTAISLSTLGQLVLLHIANLTIFENLDLAPWRRLESRMRLFELTSPPKSDGLKEEVPQIHLDSRNHVPYKSHALSCLESSRVSVCPRRPV